MFSLEAIEPSALAHDPEIATTQSALQHPRDIYLELRAHIEQQREAILTTRRRSLETPYGGPCPPIGVHRYFFKLYALDDRLTLSAAASIARTELVGTYGKTGK
ncbi:hypothetical protein [Ensifer sp. CCNWLY38]|uniref:hypothetical protein n=1 Tax=unclassified Ensifer TaxID=2633371 RepID=UPI003FA5FD14